MGKVKYSFVQNEENNQLVFRSDVESFGLNHVSEKDFESFYTNFSKSAHFDTGLLPVDGSGMLSIRTAGAHTQIGYQHAPGMYFINWGGYEGDPSAEKLYVAQPYRVVIADLYNGNLLGARTFYSPIPIQHPSAPLYHVNLPNINCRGYRKNAVGWICLYHNEDISAYPFNEKVAKILDRCSGTEAYNDANMSETDGPRFYKDKGKPSHIWNPKEWEEYSAWHGYEWMMDPDLLIPVLVQDMDNQDKHYDDGQPLTYADAVLGSYRAYYHDEHPDKLYNTLIRDDKKVNSDELFGIFKTAYNNSTTFGSEVKKFDPFSASVKVRSEVPNIVTPAFVSVDEEDEEGGMICQSCDEVYDEDDICETLDGHYLCNSCIENCHWVDHAQGYVYKSSNVVWVSKVDAYYYLPLWDYTVACSTCDAEHPYDHTLNYTIHDLPFYYSEISGNTICTKCYTNNIECGDCGEKTIPDPSSGIVSHQVFNHITKDYYRICNACYSRTPSSFKIQNLDENCAVSCACGSIFNIEEFSTVTYPAHYSLLLTHNESTNDMLANLIKQTHLFSNDMYVRNKIDMVGPKDFIDTHVYRFETKAYCPSCAENRYSPDDYQESNHNHSSMIINDVTRIVASKNIINHIIYGLNITAFPIS